MKDQPWGECNHGKELTQNQLARLLKPFGLRPKTVRDGSERAKGYMREDFNETCARYLIPAVSTVTPCQANNIKELHENNT
jgi:Protein of unknown function (DUF3631)